MKSKRLSRRCAVACVLVISVLVAGCRRDARVKLGLLDLIPADSAFCVCLNDVDPAITALDQFVDGLAPFPQPVRNLGLTSFGAMLGNLDLVGIDMTRPFGGFGVIKVDTLPDRPGALDDMLFIGLLFPVTDYKTFRAECDNMTDAEGEGLAKVTLGAKTMLVGRVGDYALLSPTADAGEFASYLGRLSQGSGMSKRLRPIGTKDAASHSVWVRVDMGTLNRLLAPKLDDAFGAMKAMVAAGMAASGQATAPTFAETIVGFYSGVVKTLLSESEALSFGLNVSPDAVSVNTALVALPETAMAKMMAGERGGTSIGSGDALKYLADGAIVNAVAHMDAEEMRGLIETSMRLFSQLSGEDGREELLSEMTGVMNDFVGAMGSSFAFSMRQGSGSFPFAASYYYEIKDAALYNQAMDKSAAMVNAGRFSDFYSGLGMEMDASMARAVEEYRGASIDAFSFTMKAAGMGAEADAMVNAMYGEGFKGRLALVDGVLAYVIGGDTDADIRGLIDTIRDGGPPAVGGETTRALAQLPPDARPDVFATYNYVRLMQMSARMMSGLDVPGNPAAAMSAAFDVPTESSLIFHGGVGEGRGNVAVIVPKKHVQELMTCFKSMRGK